MGEVVFDHCWELIFVGVMMLAFVACALKWRPGRPMEEDD